MRVLADQAVVAVCGFSGAGKTTLLEAAIPRLIERGYSVGAIKHDAHGLQIDSPHKDSGRLFAVGADVAISGPGEMMHRRHLGETVALPAVLMRMLSEHDLVLVEGHKHNPLPKVWLGDVESMDPPQGVEDVIETLPPGDDRLDTFLKIVEQRLHDSFKKRQLRAGVLIGGASRRMGQPKHLLEVNGSTVLENTAEILTDVVDDLVLLGDGQQPQGMAELVRICDAPEITGPLAGMAAALRWAPRDAWLIAACDLPGVSRDAVRWLVGQRAPGRWAIVPESREGRAEPLLAVYEPQMRRLIEELLAAGILAPRHLAEHPRVFRPRIPEAMQRSWSNANSPEDLARYQGDL